MSVVTAFKASNEKYIVGRISDLVICTEGIVKKEAGVSKDGGFPLYYNGIKYMFLNVADDQDIIKYKGKKDHTTLIGDCTNLFLNISKNGKGGNIISVYKEAFLPPLAPK